MEKAHKCFQLTFIRHGETEENRLSIIQGQADTLLNELGRQQARMAAEKLSRETFTSIYSSDLVRAKETADIIASSLQEKLEILTDVRLREKCFGVMEGMSYSSLLAEVKKAGARNTMTFTPPGAETVEMLNSRGLDFFCEMCNLPCPGGRLPVPDKSILSQYLAANDGELTLTSMPSRHLLVASHGGIIHSLLWNFARRCKCTTPLTTHGVPNCSISSLLVTVRTNKMPISPESLTPAACTVTPLCLHSTDHLDRMQSTL